MNNLGLFFTYVLSYILDNHVHVVNVILNKNRYFSFKMYIIITNQ